MLALSLALLLGADVDPVLAKAFEHADLLDKLRADLAWTTTTRYENVDGSGTVTSVDEVVTRVSHRAGVESKVILNAHRDGREFTDAEKKTRLEDDANQKKFSVESPFRKANRERYRFTVTGPEGPGVRIDFAPAGDAATNTNVGFGVVDPANGAPLKLQFHPSDLPFYIVFLNVLMEYDRKAPERPMPLKVRVDALGGVLFIKRGVNTVSTFSDFAPTEPL